MKLKNGIRSQLNQDRHQVSSLKFISGDTADVMYGYVEDECIGLIMSKRKEDGSRVIITGFAAPESYWKSC